MANLKNKNALMAILAVVLIAGAVLALFRDRIFSSSADQPKFDQETVAAVGAAVGGSDGKPEPDSPNPPARGSGRLPRTKTK